FSDGAGELFVQIRSTRAFDICERCENLRELSQNIIALHAKARLKRSPARKTVFARDLQLRLCELGARLQSAQFHETLLCLLLQMFQIGTRRQSFTLGHETPSFF